MFVFAGPGLADDAPVPLHQAILEEPVHHGTESPIDVTIAMDGQPAKDAPAVLRTTFTPRWGDMTDVKAWVSVGDGMSVVGADEVVLGPLADGVEAVATFTVLPETAGRHLVTVRASGAVESVDGTVGGWREAYFELPEVGLGEFHLDGIFELDFIPSVVDADDGPISDAVLSASTPMPLSEAPTLTSAELPTNPERPEALAPEASSEEDRDGAPAGEPSGDGDATVDVKVCWYYEHENPAQGDRTQRDMWIEFWDNDPTTDDLLASGFTGSDGCITRTVDRHEPSGDDGNGHQEIYFKAVADTGPQSVRTAAGSVYICGSRDQWQSPSSTTTLLHLGHKKCSANQIAYRTFQYIENGWRNIEARHGININANGKVITETPSDADGACGGACYFLGSDTIHIPSHRDKAPDNTIHEYGHYVQDKLYGDSYWPSPGGSHSLCGDNQDRGLAWTEGFADYYGPRVNREEFPAPSADGDTNYNRPWDGSEFSFSLETDPCSSTVQGDDNEWNVAMALWDLVDANGDGADLAPDEAAVSGAFLYGKMDDCNDSTYNDFYNGGGASVPGASKTLTCNWITSTSTGTGNACDLVSTAWQNEIDFNSLPSANLHSTHDTTTWVRANRNIFAGASDPEGCGSGHLDVEFRVSTNNFCSTSDIFITVDDAPNLFFIDGFLTFQYSGLVDTTTLIDGADYWLCARTTDYEGYGSFDTSGAEWLVDNALPDLQVSLNPAAPDGNNGWYVSTPVQATTTCTDAHSGVNLIQRSIDGGAYGSIASGSTYNFFDNGMRTHDARCTDVAGNVINAPTENINIDTVDPVTTSSLAGTFGSWGWYTSTVTVTLNCSDTTSGCADTRYQIDGGPTLLYGGPFAITEEGYNTVTFWSTDVAGNIETSSEVLVKIDTIAPDTVVALSGNGGDGDWFDGEATVSMGCFDGNTETAERSGCRWTKSRVDAASFGFYAGPSQVMGDGVHKVCYASSDRASWIAPVECIEFGQYSSDTKWAFEEAAHAAAGGSDQRTLRQGNGDVPLGGDFVSLAAGTCNTFLADSTSGSSHAFSDGMWTASVYAVNGFADLTTDHRFRVGVSSGSGTFTPALFGKVSFSDGAPYEKAMFSKDLAGFSVPANEYAAVQICNDGATEMRIVTDGQSWVRAPAGSTYPSEPVADAATSATGVPAPGPNPVAPPEDESVETSGLLPTDLPLLPPRDDGGDEGGEENVSEESATEDDTPAEDDGSADARSNPLDALVSGLGSGPEAEGEGDGE